MDHPRKCDCARCRLPTKFYDSLGLDVKYIDPEDKARRIFEARQGQEERVLLRIGSTGREALYMGSNDYLNNEDREVQDVLADIITRFFAGSEHFSTLEIQIAAQELSHTIDKEQLPANALLRLLMGAVVNFSDRPELQYEVKAFLKASDADNNKYASGLMKHLGTAYIDWLDKAKSTDNLWLVRFAKDRTSTLVHPSQDYREGHRQDQRPEPELPKATGTTGTTLKGFSSLPDSQIRAIMVRNEAEEKKKHPEIFNGNTGPSKGRAKPPYWPVAFATDHEGHRYLSNAVLGSILPRWDEILRGETSRSFSGYKTNWANLASEIEKWRVNEKEKLQTLGIEEWPAPYIGRRPDFGDPDRPSQVWYKVTPTRGGSASDTASNADSNDYTSAASSGELDGYSKLSSRAESPAPSQSSNLFTSRKPRLSDAGESSSRQSGTDVSTVLHNLMDGLQRLNQRLDVVEKVQKSLQNLRIQDRRDPARDVSPTASRASSRWAPSVEPRSPRNTFQG